MEFNKCSRCGNFFISNDDVCPKCKTKDTLEFETFKSYIGENRKRKKKKTEKINFSLFMI